MFDSTECWNCDIGLE